MDGLTVGRMVHYVRTTNIHEAATISEVIDKEKGIVVLHIFSVRGATAVMIRSAIKYDEKMEPNTWHWIEKV
jgi:hypothetical protein